MFDALGFTIRNFGDIMAVVGIKVAEAVTNMGERASYFAEVVTAFGGWFADNFTRAFADAFNAPIAALTNFSANFTSIIEATIESARSWFSKPTTFEVRPLLAGLEAKTPAFEAPEMKPLSDMSADRQAGFDKIADKE